MLIKIQILTFFWLKYKSSVISPTVSISIWFSIVYLRTKMAHLNRKELCFSLMQKKSGGKFSELVH